MAVIIVSASAGHWCHRLTNTQQTGPTLTWVLVALQIVAAKPCSWPVEWGAEAWHFYRFYYFLLRWRCLTVGSIVDWQGLHYDRKDVHVLVLFHKVAVTGSSHCTDVTPRFSCCFASCFDCSHCIDNSVGACANRYVWVWSAATYNIHQHQEVS